MIRDTRTIAAEGDAIALDPFAFWPDVASRLVGFGGEKQAENRDYAFHTLYVSCGSGPILFTVRFEGLQSQRGTLILRVHELPEVMGAQARQVAISQTQVVDLIRGDGMVSLAANARSGNHYALLAFIYGDTVAHAKHVSVEIARRTADANDPGAVTRFRASAGRVAAAPQIVGTREGTLVTPVSQLCTVSQMSEPVLAAILKQMPDRDWASPVDRWEHGFLARVLDRYDAARSGASGLGIGGLDDPLASWLVQHGCDLVLTTPDQDAAGKPPSLPHVQVRHLDPAAIDGLGGFDFAWATRAAMINHGDRQEALRRVEDVLRTLKPGGLLALVVTIDVAPVQADPDTGGFLRRPDIDRIVLLLLSRGHQVAQLCPWGDAVAEADADETVMLSAFGLIVRKAL